MRFLDSLNETVYVIAEVGSNHGGDLQCAMDYIDACSEAGADAVKFQSWSTETLLARIEPETREEHPAFSVLQKYQLPDEWHAPLQARCEQCGIDFLSTPFDLNKARLLRDLGLPAIKIASGDLTYTQLLKEVGQYSMPVLLSTGMADLDEIQAALDALGIDAGTQTVLMHCVGAYPPAIEDANVKAVQTLAQQFGLPVGISDHYPGCGTVIAAIALGARVVEKHVTFSRQGDTPDSPFAMEMAEFRDMVTQIRLLEKALGNGVKQCRPSEQGGIVGGRRSLYWTSDLHAGDKIEEVHMTALRPNVGDYQPVDMDSLIGATAAHSVKAGSPIRRQDVNAA